MRIKMISQSTRVPFFKRCFWTINYLYYKFRSSKSELKFWIHVSISEFKKKNDEKVFESRPMQRALTSSKVLIHYYLLNSSIDRTCVYGVNTQIEQIVIEIKYESRPIDQYRIDESRLLSIHLSISIQMSEFAKV